jgi:hypothetical protein
MKTLSSTATALLFSMVSLYTLVSCTRSNLAPPSLSTKILGKWIVKNACGSYTDYGVNRKDTTWFTVNDYFDFKADSTLLIMMDGESHNGKWQITDSRLYITQTNYMDFAGGFGLPILTNSDLQLWDTASSENTYLDQRLNLYR